MVIVNKVYIQPGPDTWRRPSLSLWLWRRRGSLYGGSGWWKCEFCYDKTRRWTSTMRRRGARGRAARPLSTWATSTWRTTWPDWRCTPTSGPRRPRHGARSPSSTRAAIMCDLTTGEPWQNWQMEVKLKCKAAESLCPSHYLIEQRSVFRIILS